jgi:hypothetical protein
MKNYILQNLEPILIGVVIGMLVINVINMIDSVICKIALIIAGK